MNEFVNNFPNVTHCCRPVRFPRFSIDKDGRERVFPFVINKRIREVLSERT